MSQSQFDGIDEDTRRSFLEKRLWIKENYEVCRSHSSQLKPFSFLLLQPSGRERSPCVSSCTERSRRRR